MADRLRSSQVKDLEPITDVVRRKQNSDVIDKLTCRMPNESLVKTAYREEVKRS